MSDLQGLADLLTERDGHRRDPSDVAKALSNLDDRAVAAWIAHVHDQPAACTAMYRRSIHGPGFQSPVEIGYWAHLFVRPEHRKRMLYPQLVFTMRRSMAPLGVHAILTAMRRPEVTEGHLKLGFMRLCSWPVLIKPIRPFQLLSKHRGIPAVRVIAPAGDAIWWSIERVRNIGTRTMSVETRPAAVVVSEPNGMSELAEFFQQVSVGRLATNWTTQLLTNRLAGGVEGQSYTVHTVRQGGQLQGVAITTLATRGHGIRTGVLLDLCSLDHNPTVIRALLSASERVLAGAGAEVILWIDGAGPETSRVMRKSGYRISQQETYTLIGHTLGGGPDLPQDPGAWRFTFLDHDAF